MILYLIRHGQSTNNLLGERLLGDVGEFDQQAFATYMSTRVADPPLTDLGQQQAKKLADFLHEARPKHKATYDDPPEDELRGAAITNRLGISRIYCSPMLRALQTARPTFTALGVQTKVWIDLHEHGGVFDNNGPDGSALGQPGLTRAQMADLFPGYILDEQIGPDGWWLGDEEDRPTCDSRAIRVAARLRRMAEEIGDKRIAMVAHGTFMDSLIKAILGRLPGGEFHFNHYNTGITRIDYAQSHSDGASLIQIRYTNRVDHLTPDLIS